MKTQFCADSTFVMAIAARRLLLFFFIPLVAAGADASLWRFVHPKAKALVGIQWSKVQRSEVGRWIQQRWINGESVPGIEFLPDIDEVLISSAGPAAGSDSGEPQLLIAIRGRFDLARVQQLLVRQGHRAQTFGTVPIYRPAAKGSTDPAFALLSSEIILVGDIQALYATIERSKLPVSEEDDEGFLGRAQLLATRYDCWAVMSEPGAMKDFLFASLAGKTLSSESQGFQAGISVKDGLAIDVVLSSRTERGARTVAAKLNRMLKASAKADGAPEYSALFQKLQISPDHTNVFITLRMNRQETAASLKVTPAPAPTVEASHTGERKVIRIEGLDEGVREVIVKP
jgi:hypothetical protein